jgi:RNase H-like domain found in reverse transcriptase/Reverse transcriptase (RNA-dependent DNA polymerase)
MIDEGWIVIYMDDILIFSKDLREHQERMRQVLQCLQEHDLYLKAEKCRFDTQEVEFLGMIVRLNQLTMDPTKLGGIKDWLTPTNIKAVQSFLGFGNFYRRFIGHFADLTHPLNDLTKKNKQFEWTTKCQTAFDALKKKFAESPVLLMPDPEKPFVIESDTSKFATGAVLRQKDMNGDWHPCGYISHSFNATQRNYEIYDQELLGII